jgi:Ca2+-binding EF-hand superfamily protein
LCVLNESNLFYVPLSVLVLGGYAPFDGDEIDDICDRIEEGKVIFDDEPDIWDSVTDEAKDFIRSLLAYEEKDRPTAYEALQHPWLTKIRRHSRANFQRQSSFSANQALGNMENFEAGSKLKQATYALIASQLLLKEEKEEIDEVFRVLDQDCSGRLSKEEVKLGYKEFFSKELSDEEVDVIFKRVNFSGSGKIEYSEFVVASLMRKDMLDDGKLRAAFDEFDMDGNGYIDSDELKTILVVDDDMDDYVLHKIIKQVDKDGDGRISFDEFKSMMYITVSQPSKQKRESWAMKRNESLSIESVASSISSRDGSYASLKNIHGAGSVLSIFDITSDASMRLDMLDDEDGFPQPVVSRDASSQTSLSQVTSATYATNGKPHVPSFRRNRSLPKQFDPRRGLLKINYSFDKKRANTFIQSQGGLLQPLGEDLLASDSNLVEDDP